MSEERSANSIFRFFCCCTVPDEKKPLTAAAAGSVNGHATGSGKGKGKKPPLFQDPTRYDTDSDEESTTRGTVVRKQNLYSNT